MIKTWKFFMKERLKEIRKYELLEEHIEYIWKFYKEKVKFAYRPENGYATEIVYVSNSRDVELVCRYYSATRRKEHVVWDILDNLYDDIKFYKKRMLDAYTR